MRASLPKIVFLIYLVVCSDKWSYAQDNQKWVGNLCDDVDNLYQSPINIDRETCQCNDQMSFELAFSGDSAPVGIVGLSGNPETFRVQVSLSFAYLYLSVSKKRAQLHKSVFIEFHTPSEHMIDGKSFPLEMQIYFKSDHDDLIGLSVPFDLSSKNITNVIFADFLSVFQRNNTFAANQSFAFPGYMNYNVPFRGISNFFQYNGTRTSSDCRQPVKWIVLTDSLFVTESDLGYFASLLRNTTGLEKNARNIQYVEDRLIYVSGLNCSRAFDNVLWVTFFIVAVAYFLFRML
jgi:carbonic anhydrase